MYNVNYSQLAANIVFEPSCTSGSSAKGRCRGADLCSWTLELLWVQYLSTKTWDPFLVLQLELGQSLTSSLSFKISNADSRILTRNSSLQPSVGEPVTESSVEGRSRRCPDGVSKCSRKPFRRLLLLPIEVEDGLPELKSELQACWCCVITACTVGRNMLRVHYERFDFYGTTWTLRFLLFGKEVQYMEQGGWSRLQ